MPQPQEHALANNNDISLENLISEYRTFSNLRVIKNLVVLSVGCLLAFCAYDGLVMLQSTLNQDGGIGVISVAVQFGFSCITALLLPEYLFEKIGCKSVITICLVLFVPYIASNFYPHWSLIIPASILIGLANSLYWAAQSAYLNHLSILYSWNLKSNKTVASTKKCNNPESTEQFGVQEMEMNAQVSNECERELANNNKEPDSWSLKSNKMVASTKKCNSKPESTEQIGVQEMEMNAQVSNECEREHGINKKEPDSWSLKSNKMVASTKKCNSKPESTEQIGVQEMEMNAQVSNECEREHEINNKEPDSWSLKSNKMVASTKKLNRRPELTEQIGVQEMEMNAQISNECKGEHEINNKELGKITEENQNNLRKKTEDNFCHLIGHPRNIEDVVTTIPPSPIKPANTKSDQKISELLASTTARFFGIHGLIYQTCHVWGNLLSYYVLRIGAVEETLNVNNTICQCGYDFCNIQTNCSTNNLREPRDDLRNLLTGVFVGISILAVVFVLFGLDELKNRRKNVFISWEYIRATCKQMKDKRQLLLIPMSLNIGIMQGFVMGDFTKDFVACAWGVHHVGLVTACLGATLALSSSVSGCLVKYLGRRAIFLAAKGLNIVALVAMCLWKPSSSETFMFFIISGMLGAVLGTFWSQLRAFYGLLFKNKEGAAFANYQLWHAIGMAVTFSYSSFICTSVKIYIYLAFSSLGMIGYLLAEKLHSSKA